MQKTHCKYYIKIDKINIDKILNKLDDIKYFEINTHTKHEELEINKVSNNEVKSQYEILEFATKLIKNNLSED